MVECERKVAEVARKLHNRQDILNSTVMDDELVPTKRMTMASNAKIP